MSGKVCDAEAEVTTRTLELETDALLGGHSYRYYADGSVVIDSVAGKAAATL